MSAQKYADFNLAGDVYCQSLTAPDRVAIESADSVVTYREAATRGAQLADALRSSPAWVRPDGLPARVGILGSRSIDARLAVIGACWSGATYVPIGVKFPQDRMLSILAQCDLAALIVDEEGVGLLSREMLAACPPLILVPDAAAVDVSGLSHLRVVSISSLPQAQGSAPQTVRADDTAYMIFTSGTTGIPKGVMVPAAAARHYTETIAAYMDLTPDDRVLDTFELTFDFTVHTMFPTWFAGAALCLLNARRVMNAVKYVRSSGITVWNSVPSLVGMLRQMRALGVGELPGVRLTLLGGEPVTKNVIDVWRTVAPNSEILNVYGPTETTVIVFAHRVPDPVDTTPGRDVVPIGYPLSGVDVLVVDETGEPVAPGNYGELAISGVQVTQGYLKLPALTAERFPILQGKRWFLSGDRVMCDAAGLYHCFGRIDGQVKVLGHRIELEDVDANVRLATHADVVGTVPWPMLEGMATGLVSFVVVESIDIDAVMQDLESRLPAYMLPKRIVALAQMPFNSNGKVDRAALAAMLRDESA